MRIIYYQVCYDSPDGYGMTTTVLSEYITYQEAENHCLYVDNYYIGELYIRKVYR